MGKDEGADMTNHPSTSSPGILGTDSETYPEIQSQRERDRDMRRRKTDGERKRGGSETEGEREREREVRRVREG